MHGGRSDFLERDRKLWHLIGPFRDPDFLQKAVIVMHAHRLFCAILLLSSLAPLPGADSVPTLAWPQYRGPSASGVNATQALPSTWDVVTGENVRWHAPIPGMAHSCPIIAGDRVYVATAISQQDADLKVGLYGDIASAADDGTQEWRLMALDKSTGKLLWNTLALSAVPRVKRHTKASHCNSTPATDGHHIVAIFGSEGLFCFDTDGKLLWKADLGPMDSGYFASPTAQWGFGSSPIIHDGKVIVQCDVQLGSFLAVFDVKDGSELWRTPRTDVPTWGTPTIVTSKDTTQVVANGWRETAGYDFASGTKLWTMNGGGDIPVPTPIFAHDLIYITSAHGSWRPIRAIHPEARGDISPEDPGKTNTSIRWAHGRKGNYMQTPIVVGDLLFACNDIGVVTCFDAKTGTIHFSERLSRVGQGFTASPVSDGTHLYFASELGNVFVVAAEKKLRIVGVHPLPETCMSTPAIADGLLFFRTRHRLVAIGLGGKAEGIALSAQTKAAAEPPAIVLGKPDPALVGNWQGTLKVGDATLRIHIAIRETDSRLTGTLTSLDQGNAKMELSRIGAHENSQHMEIDKINATFIGRWNEAKDALEGKWDQPGSILPLTLRRTDPLKP